MQAGCKETEAGWRIRHGTSCLGGDFGRSLAKMPAQAQKRTGRSVTVQALK